MNSSCPELQKKLDEQKNASAIMITAAWHLQPPEEVLHGLISSPALPTHSLTVALI
jgi:hypothetical protein